MALLSSIGRGISANAFLKKRIREAAPFSDKSTQKSCFDAIQGIVMKDIQMSLEKAAAGGGKRGPPVHHAGQLGRAQLHLTRQDLPLLNACFELYREDIKGMVEGLDEAASRRFSMKKTLKLRTSSPAVPTSGDQRQPLMGNADVPPENWCYMTGRF